MANKVNRFYILISGLLMSCGIGYASSDSSKLDISQKNFEPRVASQQGNSTSSHNNLDKMALLLKLQAQVEQLQDQVIELKSKQQENTKSTSEGSLHFTTYNSKVSDANKGRVLKSSNPNSSLDNLLVGHQISSDILENIDSDHSIISLGQEPLGGIFNKAGGIDVGSTSAITTQGQVTYLGSYSGNNAIPIGMVSSSLFASTLLGQRNKFSDYSVFFGGYLQADAQAWFGSKIAREEKANISSTGQSIYLTNAKLYFLSNVGHYVTAQLDFDTNEASNFSLGNAFVMLGNLDTSPFFVTVGRNSLSVGSYGGGGPLTSGITGKFLSPGRVTNVSINYKTDTINTNIAVFGTDNGQANFSTGLFYADSLSEHLLVGFNVGYVFNIAGAGNSSISKFLKDKKTNNNVGVFNIDANLAYTLSGGVWQIQSGWSTTTNSNKFNGDNNEDVLAGAWYTALNYSLNLLGKKTNFGVSYGQSYNAASIPMSLSNASSQSGNTTSGVKRQLIVSAQRAYFDDNILFGPEYSYQALYNGQHMNAITLDMSIYI